MKKQLLLLYLFSFLGLLLFSSCEYEPIGSNFVVVDSNYTEPKMFVELPAPGTELGFESKLSYQVKFKLNGDDFTRYIRVKILLDDKMIYDAHRLVGDFPLFFYGENEVENHTLKMIIINHTGTGSIADKYEKEVITKEYSWPIVVYDLEKYYSSSLEFSEVDGRLKISWKKFPLIKDNFIRIDLNKTYLNDKVSDTVRIFSTNDYADTSFIDESYVGECANYNFKIYSTFHKNGIVVNTNKNREEIKFSHVVNDDQSVTINFDKIKYYKNTSKISFKNYKNYYFIEEFNISDYSANSIKTNKIMLGIEDSILIELVPSKYYKNPNEGITDWQRVYRIKTGEDSFQFLEIENGPGDIIYYTESISSMNFILNQYSVNQNKILNSIPLQVVNRNWYNCLIVSPSGKYLIINYGNKIGICLDGNLNNITYITEEKLMGKKTQYGILFVSVSDNGILAAYSYEKLILYDLIQNIELLNNYHLTSEIGISSDGKYLISKKDETGYHSYVYKIDNNNITISLDFQGRDFIFDPNYNSRFYYYDFNSGTKILDLESNQSKFFSKIGIRSADFQNRRFLTSTDKLYNMKVVDAEENKDICEFRHIMLSFDILLKGDYIYFSQGGKWKFR